MCPQDLARPFLLACATRQSGLCALGFAALQQLVAVGALSPASTRALITHLSQVRLRALWRKAARSAVVERTPPHRWMTAMTSRRSSKRYKLL